jgi:hypothetical protein
MFVLILWTWAEDSLETGHKNPWTAIHVPMVDTADWFIKEREHALRELYYLFQNTTGEVLKMGRARHNPTPQQRLAVIARDRCCTWPGCSTPADLCGIHHFNEWLADQGQTDVEVLGLFCRPHHRHLHLENLKATRETDGTVTIRDRRSNQIILTTTPKHTTTQAA